MKIATVTFGSEFDRLVDVLAYSVAVHNPAAEFERVSIAQPASQPKRMDFCVFNTAKLEVWRDIVHASDQPTVLTDGDMLNLGPLDDAFEQPFDIAYTSRPHLKWLNGGVFFVRPTDAGRRFMDAWLARNNWLMNHPEVMDPRLHRCGGVNQMALMDVLNEPPDGWTIGCLPCAKWNSVDHTWIEFNDDTRMLHIKGKLRRAVLNGERLDDGTPFSERVFELADLWNHYSETMHNARVHG